MCVTHPESTHNFPSTEVLLAHSHSYSCNLYQRHRKSIMDMPMDVLRAMIADTISTMSIEELRNIILQTPDKELGGVGAAVLAEKRKNVVNPEGSGSAKAMVVLRDGGKILAAVVPTATEEVEQPGKDGKTIGSLNETVQGSETGLSKRKCKSRWSSG
jgi:hypothetical protein